MTMCQRSNSSHQPEPNLGAVNASCFSCQKPIPVNNAPAPRPCCLATVLRCAVKNTCERTRAMGSGQNNVDGSASGVVRSNIPLLTAAFLAALTTGGNTYAFGLYGRTLKTTLGLSQSQLDTIGSANFCAGLLSWLPGSVADKRGPRAALTFGGIAGAVSMMSYWLVAREFIPLPRVMLIPTLCTFGVLIFLSNSMVIGGVFKCFVVTCRPDTKGSVVGAAKGYVGLGSGAYACMFQSLRSHSSSDLDFLPFAALCAILAATIPARLLLPNKESFPATYEYDRLTPWHLRSIYFGLVGLGVLVIGTSVARIVSYEEAENDDQANEQSHGPNYWMSLLLFSLWFGPILALLVLPTHDVEAENNDPQYGATMIALHAADHAPNSFSSSNHSYDGVDQIKCDGLIRQSGNGEATQGHAHEQGYNLWQMLQTVPAWLFAWICIVCVGGGTIMTNNMGQMTEALYLPYVATTASLALFSAAQAASRVVTGALSDSSQHWTSIRIFDSGGGVPRPAFLVAASLAEFIAHLVLSLASSQVMFVIGVALSGAAFGMIWPLMVLIIGEVFGNANVGANYMFYDGGASAVGTVLLAKFLSQYFYESNIDEDDENSDGVTCYGQACFQGSHITIAALSLTCVFASIGMIRTTRHAYARQHSSPTDYGSLS